MLLYFVDVKIDDLCLAYIDSTCNAVKESLIECAMNLSADLEVTVGLRIARDKTAMVANLYSLSAQSAAALDPWAALGKHLQGGLESR